MNSQAWYYNTENHFKFELNYYHINPHNSLQQINYRRLLINRLFIQSLIINKQIRGLKNKGMDNEHYYW